MGNKTKTEIVKNDYYYYIKEKYVTLIKEFKEENDDESLNIAEYIPDNYLFENDMEILSKEDQFEILRDFPELIKLLPNAHSIFALMDL